MPRGKPFADDNQHRLKCSRVWTGAWQNKDIFQSDPCTGEFGRICLDEENAHIYHVPRCQTPRILLTCCEDSSITTFFCPPCEVSHGAINAERAIYDTSLAGTAIPAGVHPFSTGFNNG
ncbi:MAG TPA: hypothetical protein VKM55_19815 [Candidatus Lokiarchaeia archaeon]|nr:hypothetical protein [Candidatus Lokiarchaeia archaeon]